MTTPQDLPRVVALGGGHGLSATLTALRRLTDHLTAVVTVADDGGSSGRLRDEFDILPPGDLRMALAALCSDGHVGRAWASVLQSRFTGSGPLGGHAIGNLLIAGLWQHTDPVRGLDMVGELLGSRGRVLPMAGEPLVIEADVIGDDRGRPDEQSVVRGQVAVARTPGEVLRVRLDPPDPSPCPEAAEAIRAADYVVLGPGSWFSSVIPHVLVPSMVDAMVESNAAKILILNLEPREETEDFTAARHVELLAEHVPRLRWDYVVADAGFGGGDHHIEAWARSLGAELVVADVAVRDGSPRHDPLRLGSVLADVMKL